MKKRKLLTSLMALVLVLSLGSCNEQGIEGNSEELQTGESSGSSEESSEDKTSETSTSENTSSETASDGSSGSSKEKWEYNTPKDVLSAIKKNVNYYLRFEYIEQKASKLILYSDYLDNNYDAEELRASYRISNKQLMDAYYTEDAILLVYYGYEDDEYIVNKYELIANDPYNTGSSMSYEWYYEPNGDTQSWVLSKSNTYPWNFYYWTLGDYSTFNLDSGFTFKESGTLDGKEYDAYTLSGDLSGTEYDWYYLYIAGGAMIWGDDLHIYYSYLSHNLTYMFPYEHEMMTNYTYEGFTYNAVGDDGLPASDDTILYLTSKNLDITINHLGEIDLDNLVRGAANAVAG
ncbi:MAG: hypothetical protein LUD22_04275 [Coprobacillus sp.]|nr:hypothetical protein [Coprobacillus sp.]